MNKRHYEHTLPNIRGSLSNTYSLIQNPANIKMMLIKQIGSFLNPFKEL